MASRMPETAEARSVVSDDDVCGGFPRLEGTRIRVSDVAVAYDHHGLSPEEIVREFPALRLQDVHAALAHYHANAEEIRTEIREREERLRQATRGSGDGS
jgi:uncharacterized protein (DUF433 family)